MLLSIIIISYNTKELLEQCLESIVKSLTNSNSETNRHPDENQDHPNGSKTILNQVQNDDSGKSVKNKAPNISYEIIVVDNNSTDGTREYLEKLLALRVKQIKEKRNVVAKGARNISANANETNKLKINFSEANFSPALAGRVSQFPNIKVILNNNNLGFAKAVNQGIRESKGKYILLLNSDIKVLPEAIKKLINFARKREDAGIVVPKLLSKDGKTSQASCYKLPTVRGALNEYWFGKKGSYEKYLPRGGNPVKVEAAVGAAMLIPKAVIDVVGLLDEKYFMYFEDLDYCHRVSQNGLAVYYLPQAKMIHHHGQSGKKTPIKVSNYLTESSKKFNGFLKYNLISMIIKLSRLRKISFLFLTVLTALITAICLLLWLLFLRRN